MMYRPETADIPKTDKDLSDDYNELLTQAGRTRAQSRVDQTDLSQPPLLEIVDSVTTYGAYEEPI